MFQEKFTSGTINSNETEFSNFLFNLIADRLLTRLQYIRLEPKKILELGTKNNHCKQQLKEIYPQADIQLIDISADIKATNYPIKTNVNSNLYSLEKFPFEENTFDLIFSNIPFSQGVNLGVCLSECLRVLSGHGLFMFSMFGSKTFDELRSSWQKVDDYSHVQVFLELQEIGDTLQKMHWADPVMDKEIIILQYENIEKLCYEIKLLGGGNFIKNKRKGLTTPRQFQKMSTAYESFRNSENKLPVTYEIYYGQSWGKAWRIGKFSPIEKGIKVPLTKIKREKP